MIMVFSNKHRKANYSLTWCGEQPKHLRLVINHPSIDASWLWEKLGFLSLKYCEKIIIEDVYHHFSSLFVENLHIYIGGWWCKYGANVKQCVLMTVDSIEFMGEVRKGNDSLSGKWFPSVLSQLIFFFLIF